MCIHLIAPKKKELEELYQHIESKDGWHSHSCNDEYHAFYYKLYQWGVESLSQNSDEGIVRELKFNIKDREN